MIPRRTLVAVAAVAVAGAAMAILLDSGPSSPPAGPVVQRPALLAYESQILPVVQDGGRVVQLGMKPALDNLRSQQAAPGADIAQQAAGWIASLRSVKGKVALLPAPAGLSSARRSFLQALDEYILAAMAFRAAALAEPGAARSQLVAKGIGYARQADTTYNRGAAVLQQARTSLGLPANPNFPGSA